MIFLKVLGIVVASTGAAVALWGKPRKGGEFTRQGLLSLFLIAIGVILSLSLEIKQWRQKKNEELYQQRIARIEQEWENTSHQKITKAKVSYYYRHEMKPDDFEKYLETAEISFLVVASGTESRMIIRRLRFLSQDGKKNAEERIRLAVTDRDRVRTVAKERITLLKKETMSESEKVLTVKADDISLVEDSKSTALSEDSQESDKENESHIVGTVISETFVINGWPYSSSSKHDWFDPNSLTCGIDASIAWHNLELGDDVKSIDDISRITGISVRFPERADLEKVDRFTFAIITGDNQAFIFPFHLFQKEINRKQYVIDISGYDLLQFAKKEFYKRGGRTPIPIVLR